jgi:RNA polymerase sigma factor (TIGR02999 family)
MESSMSIGRRCRKVAPALRPADTGCRARAFAVLAIAGATTPCEPDRMSTDSIAPPRDDAGDGLFAQAYERLKAIASRQIARDRGVTLNTTELVHELYERMNRQEMLALGGPRNFFAYAANAMRNILTDRARHRLARKSGGDWIRVTVSEHGESAADELALDVIALNDALVKLQAQDERAAKVVELRYFAGLPVERIAELMDVNRRTVTRDWNFARAFLHAELEQAG